MRNTDNKRTELSTVFIALVAIGCATPSQSREIGNSTDKASMVAQNTEKDSLAFHYSQLPAPGVHLSDTLPDGLSLSVTACMSASNAISCDINVRSTLESSVTLSLHGVYWSTGAEKWKKTAILSKTADKLSTELLVVPGADFYVSSLIVANRSAQTKINLSLGIHFFIGETEYFVNTKAVALMAVTG